MLLRCCDTGSLSVTGRRPTAEGEHPGRGARPALRGHLGDQAKQARSCWRGLWTSRRGLAGGAAENSRNRKALDLTNLVVSGSVVLEEDPRMTALLVPAGPGAGVGGDLSRSCSRGPAAAPWPGGRGGRTSSSRSGGRSSRWRQAARISSRVTGRLRRVGWRWRARRRRRPDRRGEELGDRGGVATGRGRCDLVARAGLRRRRGRRGRHGIGTWPSSGASWASGNLRPNHAPIASWSYFCPYFFVAP